MSLHSKMPDPSRDTKTLEPFVRMEILTPSEYNGVSMQDFTVISRMLFLRYNFLTVLLFNIGDY